MISQLDSRSANSFYDGRPTFAAQPYLGPTQFSWRAMECWESLHFKTHIVHTDSFGICPAKPLPLGEYRLSLAAEKLHRNLSFSLTASPLRMARSGLLSHIPHNNRLKQCSREYLLHGYSSPLLSRILQTSSPIMNGHMSFNQGGIWPYCRSDLLIDHFSLLSRRGLGRLFPHYTTAGFLCGFWWL